MAATQSSMLELGTIAPDFSLPDTEGNSLTLRDVQGPLGCLVVFMCNHCPYVIHIQKKLVEVTQWALKNGVGVVGINANDVENYPDDSPDQMKKEKTRVGYPFPYLFDETQKTAHAYQAACTPDFFLFDKDSKLFYRGQFDESRPKNQVEVTGKDLRQALVALVEGRAPTKDQRPSLGCNIKWKRGNEPTRSF